MGDVEAALADYRAHLDETENFKQAVYNFSRVLELTPDNAEAYHLRGLAWGNSGDPEQAIPDFTKAIELNPDYAEVYYHRGRAYAGTGDFEQAIVDFSKTIELEPDYVEAYIDRGAAYANSNSGTLEQAIVDFNKALELNPDEAKAYYYRAVAYDFSGKLEQAILDYTKYIELNPEDAEAYNNRGSAYNNSGDFERAILDYTQAIELDPDYINAYYNRGLAYARSGDFEQAILDYTQAIELDPEEPDAHLNRGVAYANTGASKQAIIDLERYLELAPDAPDREEVLSMIEELRAIDAEAPRAIYDGSWLGTTDQGQFIEFQIENSGVRSINVGFAIPGCEGDSPVGMYFGTPKHFITDGSLDITLGGLYDINVKGNFTSASSVSGILEITSSNPCGQSLSVSWSAVPAETFEPPPLTSEHMARIPDIDIPNELLLPEVGAKNFNEFTRILGHQGDWFLVTSFDSIYPIPYGWTTLATGQEDAILVFRKGGIQIKQDSIGGITFDEEPEIVITVGGAGGEYQTSDQIMSELEDAISQVPNVSLIKRQVVDSKKAYIFLEVKPEAGNNIYRLIVMSQSPDGWFRTLSIITDVQDWNDYYPIIRAITENWALSWDNSTLGVALPETLVE